MFSFPQGALRSCLKEFLLHPPPPDLTYRQIEVGPDDL